MPVLAGNEHVSWRDLLTLLLLVVMVSAAAGGGMTYWMLAHFRARVPLADQAMSIQLPENLPVRFEIVSVSESKVPKGTAPVPVEQTVPLHIKQRFTFKASIDSLVPFKAVLPYRGDIPIRTTLHLDTKIKTRVLGIPMTLPVVADVPLDTRLPIDLRIPVDQSIQMKFTVPVTTDVDQVVRVPLPGVMDSRISVEGPLQLRIREGELDVPLNRVSLEGRVPWAGQVQLGPAQAPPPAAPIPLK